MTKTTALFIPYEVEQLMAIYNANNPSKTRVGLISVMAAMKADIPQQSNSEEDAMLLATTNSALELLCGMSDEDFYALDLVVDFPAVEI